MDIRCPQMEYTQTTQVSGFKTLSPECIFQIFQHLPIADRFRIERVCKRWRILSEHSWFNFKTLDMHYDTWGIATSTEFFELDVSTIEKLERLCGRYVKNFSLNLATFRKIGQSSKDIQKLELFEVRDSRLRPRACNFSSILYHMITFPDRTCTCPDDWRQILTWLIPKCHRVSTFRLIMNRKWNCKEEEVVSLLEVMKNLEILTLKRIYINESNWNGTCFDKLTFDNLREISLECFNRGNNNILISIIKKCKKLRRIKLLNVRERDVYLLFKAISTHAESLKTLEIVVKYRTELAVNFADILLNMAKCTFLEKLRINYFSAFLNNEILKVIGKCCKKLTHLDISNCSFSDEGIAALCDLEELKLLNISYIHNLKNPMLQKFKKLEFFCCCHCKKLKDESICALLSEASQLREINISCCELLTINTVTAAARCVNMRSSNLPLNFCVKGCPKIQSEYQDITAPLLKVHFDLRDMDFAFAAGNCDGSFERLTTNAVYFMPH